MELVKSKKMYQGEMAKMELYETFIEAIDSQRKVSITFNSKEKGIITRECIPYDFGPSNRFNDKQNRYHIYDLSSPKGPHIVAILSSQIINITLLDETFDPGDYVSWPPNWYYPRDWGHYS